MFVWKPHAERLAQATTSPRSRWRGVVAAVPRHVFVPNWWTWAKPAPGPYGTAVWDLTEGPSDPDSWVAAAYADRSLVTRVGVGHADDAHPGDTATGSPTSSATLPGLLVRMFRHAELADRVDVLDVGTGSGYGTALLATRLGSEHVTGMDVDPYLVEVAAERLARVGLRPDLQAADATGPLPGTYDRIIATFSPRSIPASWMTALRPGGRLVTTIAGTSMIITADAVEDGGAVGRVEWDRAGFMPARTGPDYPPDLAAAIEAAHTAQGKDVAPSRYPVLNVMEAWELYSMLGIVAPGIEHDFRQEGEARTAVMIHPDGSWARATSASPDGPAYVHQGGPRRLWDLLDDLRARWLRDGSLPVYGATARVDPDGRIHLRRGSWRHTL